MFTSINKKTQFSFVYGNYWKILLLAVMLIQGCTKLDEKPYTTLDPDSFYKNEGELEMAVVAVYNRFRSSFNADYYMCLETVTEYGSPTNTKGDMQRANAWIDINNAGIGYSPKYWANAYVTINAANLVLARGQDVPMDEAAKERLFAEVRFLRAYTYFVLVRLYGGVPMPESYTSSLDGLEIPRKTIEENYAQIIEDLEYGVEKLPKKSEMADAKWKVSKGAAQALLGDVYLTRGCMENNEDFFVQAKKQLGDVISSGEYALEENYDDLWFWFNQTNKNGKESVFELQNGSNQNNGVTLFLGCFNGKFRSLGTTHYLRSGPSIQAYLSYDKEKDVRIHCMLTEFKDDGGETLRFDPNDKGAYPGSQRWGSASPGNVKWYDRTESAFLTDVSKADIYLIRYADVLLNYAEVENHLAGGSGDALEKLNMVRRRAGLDELAGLSQQGLEDAIFQERGWEFIGEGQNYYDELRTDRLGKAVYEEVKAGVQQQIYQYLPLQFVPQKTFLWKIPQNDLNSNPALEQNPDNVSDSRYPIG